MTTITMNRALLERARDLLWQLCSDLSRGPNSEGLRSRCLSMRDEIVVELGGPRYPMAEIFDDTAATLAAQPQTIDEAMEVPREMAQAYGNGYKAAINSAIDLVRLLHENGSEYIIDRLMDYRDAATTKTAPETPTEPICTKCGDVITDHDPGLCGCCLSTRDAIQPPGPAWHDAPTKPGLWANAAALWEFSEGEISGMRKNGRWCGPLPQDHKETL